MGHPSPKTISSDLRISVDQAGYPYWTRIDVRAPGSVVLNEEQARDLHYALTRIVAYLDSTAAK